MHPSSMNRARPTKPNLTSPDLPRSVLIERLLKQEGKPKLKVIHHSRDASLIANSTFFSHFTQRRLQKSKQRSKAAVRTWTNCEFIITILARCTWYLCIESDAICILCYESLILTYWPPQVQIFSLPRSQVGTDTIHRPYLTNPISVLHSHL